MLHPEPSEDPMTEERMALVDLLQKSDDGDFLRTVAEAVLQILMEADVESLIGAGRHERTSDRLTHRNGYRDRSLDTRLGSLQLRIPKLCVFQGKSATDSEMKSATDSDLISATPK
jgi:transposase-like protein